MSVVQTCPITQKTTEELCCGLAGARRLRGNLESDGTGTTFRGTVHCQRQRGLAHIQDHNSLLNTFGDLDQNRETSEAGHTIRSCQTPVYLS